MAIDTRDRRAACFAWNASGFARVWPNPGGGASLTTQAGRQHTLRTYPGILATGSSTTYTAGQDTNTNMLVYMNLITYTATPNQELPTQLARYLIDTGGIPIVTVKALIVLASVNH